MLKTLLRPVCSRYWIRRYHNVPFQDDLVRANDELFNLEDFQHYKEAPDVIMFRKQNGMEDIRPTSRIRSGNSSSDASQHGKTDSFTELCRAQRPIVFVSRLSDPYLNLSIEDYIYNQMPLTNKHFNTPRLLFYVNSPCVVIGKNQNPWKEVNLPLLNDLRIPLVRRRSGGGTVVHDFGNVNYSFMTSKENFDRFTFAELIARCVNSIPSAKTQVKVNERGDIVTKEGSLKVSGSAYKLSKGKSYHHGTMLLSSKLEVLRKLLHHDDTSQGKVVSSAAVTSVKSPVANLLISNETFIDSVISEFKRTSDGNMRNEKEISSDASSQTELLGLQDFVEAYSSHDCTIFEIDENVELPEEVLDLSSELMSWDWKYGSTPKFSHQFRNPELSIDIVISVGKKGLVDSFEDKSSLSEADPKYEFLELVLKRGDQIQYTGSNIAGLILDDKSSDWIGRAIDGTT